MAASSTPFRVLLVLLLSGVLLVGGTVQAQSTRTMTDTIAVDPDVEVELHAFQGRVEVTTWERSAVRLHGEIEDTASTTDEPPTIQVAREDSMLTVKPNGKTVESPGIFTVLGSVVWGWEEPTGPTTTYTVRVPADASVILTLDAADAKVSGVEGKVMIEGISSSITVRDIGGKVLAGTISGTINARDIRGKLLVGTFSGDLQAHLSSLAADLHVGSFSGDATITLPADAAFDLKTDVTWGGGVMSDFAIPDSLAQSEGPIPIGGGGPTVAFESFSGHLTLRTE